MGRKKNAQNPNKPLKGQISLFDSPAQFLFAGVDRLLKNKSIERLTVQNEYGTIQVIRTTPTKSNTHAIGFTLEEDTDEEDEDFDEDKYNETIEQYVRWFE